MAPRSAFALSADHPYQDTPSRIDALFQAEPSFTSTARRENSWRQRPLEHGYTLLFVDSLPVKVKEDGLLWNRRIHLAMGISDNGSKDILGYWTQEACRAPNWTAAFQELRQRGLAHIDIVICETEEAAAAVSRFYPAAFISAKPAKPAPAPWPAAIATLPPALQALCTGVTAAESVIEKRRRRGLVKQYTFASEDAAVRSLVLALRDASTTWKVSPQRWSQVRAELAQWREGRQRLSATKMS